MGVCGGGGMLRYFYRQVVSPRELALSREYVEVSLFLSGVFVLGSFFLKIYRIFLRG